MTQVDKFLAPRIDRLLAQINFAVLGADTIILPALLCYCFLKRAQSFFKWSNTFSESMVCFLNLFARAVKSLSDVLQQTRVTLEKFP